MKIRLNEIPEQGHEYKVDEKTGELVVLLKDLEVGRHEVIVQIKPVVSHFELKGHLKAEVGIVCGQCGEKTNIEVRKNLNEVLLEKEEEPRTSQYSHRPAEATSSPELLTYAQGSFNLGEYIHECIALGTPLYPVCGGDQCKNWEETKAVIDQLNQNAQEFDQEKGHPAFKALKGLNINRQ